MTNKKIIDADLLKLWLLENNYVGDTVIDQTTYAESVVFYSDLIEKINELTTHKAKFMIGQYVNVMETGGLDVLFNCVMIKEIFYPPHNFTGKDSIYYNIEYSNRETEHWREENIQSLSSTPDEPHGSIYDAEGWCWDISLAPKNTVVAYFIPDRSPPKGFPAIGKVLSIYSGSIDPKDTTAKAWRPLPTLPKGE